MKKLIGLAFVLLLATASMAQRIANTLDYDKILKWISGSTNQTVLAGTEIEDIVYNCPQEMQIFSIDTVLVDGLKLGYNKDNQTCVIYGEVAADTKGGTYTQTLTLNVKGPDGEKIPYTATSKITVQELPMGVKVTSGSHKQTLLPGESIETIVYKYHNVEKIEFLDPNVTFPEGISFNCDKANGLYTSCTVSGTIKDLTPRKYDIGLLLTSPVMNEEYFQGESHIYFDVIADLVELKSSSADRTVTAGDEIEPIIFYSHVKVVDGSIENVPAGLQLMYNPKDSTITLNGTIDDQLRDSIYNYKLIIELEDRKVIETGTIIVNHKKAKTTLEIVENGEQDVLGGDSIKPIILKYNYMLNPAATKTLGSYSVMANAEKRIITIKGKVPNVHKDTTLIITVTAEGYENNASVDVKINVKHKQATTSITTLTNNSEQTINAGESISPITFQYTNADSLWTIGTLPGKFKLEVVSKEDRTFNLVGTIDPNADAGKYELGIVVRGTDNNDTAYVYIHVNQEFRPIVFELIEGSLEQTVTAGNPITPMVFRYANIKKLGITGLPNGINYKKDSEAHEFTIYGSIAPDAISFPYEFTIDITGVDEDSTITGKITVEKPASSSSSVIASSSSVKASSSSAKPVESSSSSVIASSSTNVNSSSSSKQVEVSSSSVKQPSSSSKPVEASSSSTTTSSSTTASSSSVNNSSSSSATPASSSAEVSSSSTKQSSSSKPAEVSSSSKKESSSSKGKEPSEKSSSSNKAKSSSSEEDTFVIAKIINPMTISLEGRMLHISGAKWVNIDVFDMQGRSVASFKQVKSSASLESLLQGCYIVRVQSGSNSLTRRIAIK